MTPQAIKKAHALLETCYTETECGGHFSHQSVVLNVSNLLVFADFLDDQGEAEMAEGARVFVGLRPENLILGYLDKTQYYINLIHIPKHLQSLYLAYSNGRAKPDKDIFQLVYFQSPVDAIWCFCYVSKKYAEVQFPSSVIKHDTK